MTISVIIPTHNRAHTLPRAIDSVLQQKLRADEIVIVDDGSTDETPTLVANTYPQCRYLHQQNLGVSSARNLGIRQATGDWLAFLDSDDEWLDTRLKSQLSLLMNKPELKICHSEEIWVRNGRRVNAMKKHAKSGGWIFQKCLPLCVISPSAVIIHRSLFDEVGLFNESLPACEDYDLWLRICAHYPVGFVTEPQIIKYGGHEDQLSQRHWGMDRFRLQALEQLIENNNLKADDRRDAVDMLVKKAGILALGAEKRGKSSEATRYRAIQQRYSTDATNE
ncbi:MAG: glycosyltransferase family 2 protein [Gammaproteobacteria bacterium]|nr:glycosyltransferase family 2 protein [Gammaproteobacteria bacterium]